MPEEPCAELLLTEIDAIRDSLGRAFDPMPGEFRWCAHWLTAELQMLPLEARGLHSEMLTQAWTDGARMKRTHEDEIMRLVRATPDEWARTWPRIRHYWKEAAEPGTGYVVLVNRDQLRFYLSSLKARASTLIRNRHAAAASVRARRARRAQAEPARDTSPPPPSSRPRERLRDMPSPVPPCPECNGELKRRQRSSTGGGRQNPPHWWCSGQGISLTLNDQRIYSKLATAARQSIDTELADYERSIATAAESATERSPRPPKAAPPSNAGGLAALEVLSQRPVLGIGETSWPV